MSNLNKSHLDVSAKEISVGLCPDVFNDMTNSQDKLVLDGGHPRVVVQLEHGPGAEKVQVAQLGWQDC